MAPEEVENWISNVLSAHKELTEKVKMVLRDLLKTDGVGFLEVNGRTKEVGKIREKIVRKGYIDPPEEMMDISGIRVLVEFESQAEDVANVIRRNFEVDKKHSVCKDILLEVDQMGYRSTHFVCKFPEDRCRLKEFVKYKDLRFEVQVRTLLQHVWAQISHGSTYKIDVGLPRRISRPLFLYAGLLEVADRGLAECIAEIEKYRKHIRSNLRNDGKMIEIDVVSLEVFLEDWVKSTGFRIIDESLMNEKNEIHKILEELRIYEINNFGELRGVIPESYARVAKEIDYGATRLALIRDWLIIYDADRYIKKGLGNSWRYFDEAEKDIKIYQRLLGEERANSIVDSFRNIY